MRVGIVVPHIFMHQDILPKVIFSPGTLAVDLADGLVDLGAEVTLFTPGPISTKATNITADLSLLDQELAGREDTYIDLLKKHPLTFISLARQVQSEIIAKAYAMANADELDIIHIYTNEEDIALPFAQFCRKPVIFTHHDPFNFLVKYKNVFPKYKHLNWLSISHAQRKGMPTDTNWIGNIYHGVEERLFTPIYKTGQEQYLAYMGRIIEPKGVHLAVAAVKQYNAAHPDAPYILKIAGKHYAGAGKDSYWQERIEPLIDGKEIQYVGFIKTPAQKQEFLGSATGLIIPSTFEEPFGMVMIEALACGTPIIGLDSGAIPEVMTPDSGILVPKTMVAATDPRSGKEKMIVDEDTTIADLTAAIAKLPTIGRRACREHFEYNFTLGRMCRGHLETYKRIIG